MNAGEHHLQAKSGQYRHHPPSTFGQRREGDSVWTQLHIPSIGRALEAESGNRV
jgi:hypothetical protein